MQEYVKALWKLYREQPALYEKDYETEGFAWINHMDAERNLLTLSERGKGRRIPWLPYAIFRQWIMKRIRWVFPIPENIRKFLTVIRRLTAAAVWEIPG